MHTYVCIYIYIYIYAEAMISFFFSFLCTRLLLIVYVGDTSNMTNVRDGKLILCVIGDRIGLIRNIYIYIYIYICHEFNFKHNRK